MARPVRKRSATVVLNSVEHDPIRSVRPSSGHGSAYEHGRRARCNRNGAAPETASLRPSRLLQELRGLSSDGVRLPVEIDRQGPADEALHGLARPVADERVVVGEERQYTDRVARPPALPEDGRGHELLVWLAAERARDGA